MPKVVKPSAERSRVMRAVKSRDTTPEMIVRRMVFAMGRRFRLCRADLPGKPDLVFPGLGKVIFVHGCFWHGHDCRRGDRPPKDNADYWRAKIERNRKRDAKNLAALAALGWDALVVWECRTRDREALRELLAAFLETSPERLGDGQTLPMKKR